MPVSCRRQVHCHVSILVLLPVGVPRDAGNIWVDFSIHTVAHLLRERRLVARVQRLPNLVGVAEVAMLRWAHRSMFHVRRCGTIRRVAHGHRRLPKRCLIVVGLGQGPFCPLAPHQTDPAIYYDEAQGNDDVHVGFDAIVAVLC